MPKYRAIKQSQLDNLRSPYVVPELKIRIRRIIPEDLYRITNKGKEDEQVKEYTSESLKEQGKFVRVFTDETRKRIKASLSPRAAHLLLWIMEEMKIGEDLVVMRPKDYINACEYPDKETGKVTKVSPNTYKEAINDLVNKAIIAKTGLHETYFINPSYFFNGSRAKKYSKNVDYI